MNFPAQTIDAPVRITLITLLLLCLGLGCGKKEASEPLAKVESNTTQPKTDPTPKAGAKKPEPIKSISSKLIADPIIEKAIRKELEKPEGELTKVDLEKVTTLFLSGNQLTEVPKGLEKLTQLMELNLANNQLTDVSALANLTQLTGLVLFGNQLTVVKGLEKLTKLEALVLMNNQLTDVKGLEKLTQLKTLHLSYNKLTGVKGLEKLTHLEYLGLESNPDLTKAQIAELQKTLPKCKIFSDPKN